MELVKSFEDGSIVERGKGNFDDYCVYLTRPNRARYAPFDKDYFSFFIEKSSVHSNVKIYADFVKIYNKTTEIVLKSVLNQITEISEEYDEDKLDFNIWFTVIYLGMVAEELKYKAVLKKRIKRLAMYQILYEKMKAGDAAFYSKGKSVSELDPYCKERGF